ncbi:MAG TPA: hypothetical protein VMU39_17685 [Solirubrobacteraceae bacterium]|nr:hypothetical protein [Solirubrobacteraceae bacterium]
MTIEELARRAESVEIPRGTPALVLSSDDDIAPSLDRLGDWFGTNPDSPGVRLIVDDEERGFISQASLDDIFAVGYKGDAASAQLPGRTPGAGHTVYELRCPRPGCPVGPVFSLFYPLRCSVHADAVLERVQ